MLGSAVERRIDGTPLLDSELGNTEGTGLSKRKAVGRPLATTDVNEDA